MCGSSFVILFFNSRCVYLRFGGDPINNAIDYLKHYYNFFISK